MLLSKKTIENSTTLLLLIAVLGYCARYFVNILFTKHMTPPLYGDLSIAIRALMIVSSLILLGTNVTAVQYMPTLKGLQKKHTFIQWNLAIIKKSLIIVLGLTLVAAIFLILLHYFSIQHIGSYHLAVYFLFLSPLMTFIFLIVVYIKCEGNIIESVILFPSLFYIFIALILLLAIYFLNTTLTNFNLLTMFILVYIMLAILCSQYYTRILGQDNLVKLAFLPRKTVKDEVIWLKNSRVNMINRTLYLLLSFTDILCIELITHNESQVGYYVACTMIVGFITLITNNYLQSISTKVSTMIKAKQTQNILQKLFYKSFKLSLSIVIILSVIILTCHKQLLSHFGPLYINAYPTLLLLTIYAIIIFLTQAAAVFLLYSGFTSFILKSNLYSFIILICTCPILTYIYGMYGAALANIIFATFRAIVILIKYKKSTHIKLYKIC